MCLTRNKSRFQIAATQPKGQHDDELGNTIFKTEYDLDEINALEKKLDACERTPGLHIDLDRGETGSKSQIYLESCTGSYEYLRVHMRDILKDSFNTDDYPKVVEDEKKIIKIGVKTTVGRDANVEDQRVIYVNGRKLTMTLYYTTCSIMLQGSKNEFPETGNKTPAEYFAGELVKVSEELHEV